VGGRLKKRRLVRPPERRQEGFRRSGIGRTFPREGVNWLRLIGKSWRVGKGGGELGKGDKTV